MDKFTVSYPVLVQKINENEYEFKIDAFGDKLKSVISDDIVLGLLEISDNVKELLTYYLLDDMEFPKFIYPNMLNGNENKFYNIISVEININKDNYKDITIHIPNYCYTRISRENYPISKIIYDMIENNYF